MEIAPLSSYAAIKVPNERDYQKNELDEEFGLELHYFDARMYDAQVGRFGGVDVKAEQFSKFTPYNYGGNNPLYFIDPDGREVITLAALVVGKLLFKKAAIKATSKIVGKAFMKKMATTSGTFAQKYAAAQAAGAKALKTMKLAKTIGGITGGVSNTASNWDNINAGGRFNVFKAVGYFASGYAGGEFAAMSGNPLYLIQGMAISGGMNIGIGLLGGDLDGKSTGADFLQSFSRGASAAMVGKTFGKGVAYGGGLKSVYAPAWTKKTLVSYSLAAVEKGTGNLANYYGKFGSYGTKQFGGSFYLNTFLSGAGAGILSQGFNDVNLSFNPTNYNGVFLQSIANGLSSVSSDLLKDNLLKSMSGQPYKDYLNSLNNEKKVWKSFSLGIRAAGSFLGFGISGDNWHQNF